MRQREGRRPYDGGFQWRARWLRSLALGLGPTALGALGGSSGRSGSGVFSRASLVRRLVGERHPLVPAAVRVERSRGRGHRGATEQTAVTVWFGEGPALPGPGAGLGRAALRLGVGAVSAAAVAAAGGAAAARLGAGRDVRVVPEAATQARLQPPGSVD